MLTLRGMAPTNNNTTFDLDSNQRPLAALTEEVGDADPAVLQAHLAATSDAELVDVGRSILSGRIVTDASRLYPRRTGRRRTPPETRESAPAPSAPAVCSPAPASSIRAARGPVARGNGATA